MQDRTFLIRHLLSDPVERSVDTFSDFDILVSVEFSSHLADEQLSHLAGDDRLATRHLVEQATHFGRWPTAELLHHLLRRVSLQ